MTISLSTADIIISLFAKVKRKISQLLYFFSKPKLISRPERRRRGGGYPIVQHTCHQSRRHTHTNRYPYKISRSRGEIAVVFLRNEIKFSLKFCHFQKLIFELFWDFSSAIMIIIETVLKRKRMMFRVSVRNDDWIYLFFKN